VTSKQKQMYSLKIDVPIYKTTVHVKIAPEIKKVINKFAKRTKQDIAIPDDKDVHGYAVGMDNSDNYYIFYDVLSLNANIITHEVSHIIDFILEEKQVEMTGEARAYLTGFINEKIFDYVLKKGLFLNKYLPKKEEVKPIKTEQDEKPSGLL
jgi:hypothetical protein